MKNQLSFKELLAVLPRDIREFDSSNPMSSLGNLVTLSYNAQDKVLSVAYEQRSCEVIKRIEVDLGDEDWNYNSNFYFWGEFVEIVPHADIDNLRVFLKNKNGRELIITETPALGRRIQLMPEEEEDDAVKIQYIPNSDIISEFVFSIKPKTSGLTLIQEIANESLPGDGASVFLRFNGYSGNVYIETFGITQYGRVHFPSSDGKSIAISLNCDVIHELYEAIKADNSEEIQIMITISQHSAIFEVGNATTIAATVSTINSVPEVLRLIQRHQPTSWPACVDYDALCGAIGAINELTVVPPMIRNDQIRLKMDLALNKLILSTDSTMIGIEIENNYYPETLEETNLLIGELLNITNSLELLPGSKLSVRLSKHGIVLSGWETNISVWLLALDNGSTESFSSEAVTLSPAPICWKVQRLNEYPDLYLAIDEIVRHYLDSEDSDKSKVPELHRLAALWSEQADFLDCFENYVLEDITILFSALLKFSALWQHNIRPLTPRYELKPVIKEIDACFNLSFA